MYVRSIEHDDLEGLRALLVGHSVSIENDVLVLDDGTRLLVEGNEGCGGCPNGYFDLMSLNDFDNRIMNVEVVEREATSEEELANGVDVDATVFELFVYGSLTKPGNPVVAVIGDEGNGYYGAGFTIRVMEER